ncbi:hypothetical protein WDH52_12150 [Streptomyces sp. TRM70308]|uniref:hypothetical protein n=1 Tax=Streptomyces sp. TRM70308 TaxID=3131932 RepID=UPI003CFCF4C6
MGVFSWLRRKPSDGSRGADAAPPAPREPEAAAAAPETAAEAAAATDQASADTIKARDGAAAPTGPEPVKDAGEASPDGVGIPKQSSGEAADTESGDGART